MSLLQLTRQLVNHNRRSKTGHHNVWNHNLLVLSDIHDDKLELGTMHQPDFVLFLGDIHPNVIRGVDERFLCPKFGILGTNDKLDSFDGTSVLNLHGNVVQVDNITFAGFGGSPRYNQDEAQSYLDQLGYVDVFLAHSNAKRTEIFSENSLDDFSYHTNRVLADYIHRAQPAYFLHGHIRKELEQQVGETVIHAVYKLKRMMI